jgi:AcrR family transcriptional regulator
MDEHEKPRGRQSEATAQQTRQRIIQSAQTLFGARGFDGVSLRDIAEHSGVTHGLIRHHFGSKEDIWRAVVDTTFREYLATATKIVEGQVAGTTSALQAVRDVSRTAIVLSARYPEVMRLLLHAGVENGERLDYFMEQLTPLRALMDPLITAVKREGGLPQFSHESFLLSLVMWGAMPFAMAAFSSELCNLDMLAEEEVERHADRVIATLVAAVPSEIPTS